MNEWCDRDRILFIDDDVCKALMKMKLTKAYGADSIYAKHLRYISPEIIVILK